MSAAGGAALCGLRQFSASQISGATGTIIQDGGFTTGGGQAAIFDGTVSQSRAASGEKAIGSSGYVNYVGKDWGASRRRLVSRFIVYGPNDANIMAAGGGTTLKLQGSNDNSSWFDLTGNISFPTGSAQSVDTSSGISLGSWYRYHRVNLNGNGTTAIILAEIVFYELS